MRRHHRQNQRRRMLGIVIDRVGRRNIVPREGGIFSCVQVPVETGKLLLEISSRNMCPLRNTLLVDHKSMVNL